MKTEVLNNYLSYRKHKPEYSNWENLRNTKEAKRQQYIEKNGVSEAQKAQDLKRAEVVLNAIDIMDEYSQTRAEDMETMVQSASQAILTPISYAVMGVGLLLNLFKPVRNLSDKIAKSLGIELISPMVMPLILSFGASIASVPIISAWGAKKELQASRMGRLEAMNKELSSDKQFAILTDEQIRQRDEIAKTINVPKKDVNKFHNATKGLGIIESFKLLRDSDDEYVDYAENLEKKAKEDSKKFDTVKLSKEEELEAKKDKQLITTIVEKVDIASQDYAENIELATDTLETVTLGSGGLLGLGLNQLLKTLNVSKNKAKGISLAFGSIITLIGSICAAKLQKQGSRVARFKVKQDLMQNPQKLFYVDDDKLPKDGDVKIKPENKESMLQFLKRAFKDNKEYNEYIKKEAQDLTRKNKAQEQIELTQEQKQRAKQLQQNIFKTFNKLDEKSQAYSESTEAVGETVRGYASFIPAILLSLAFIKQMKDLDKMSDEMLENFSFELKGFIPAIISFIPTVLFNTYVTKEQKTASRVADMIALKELDDYRNFVDYDNVSNKANKKDNQQISTTKKVTTKKANTPFSKFFNVQV